MSTNTPLWKAVIALQATTWPSEVQAFRTSDGALFSLEFEDHARAHQTRLDFHNALDDSEFCGLEEAEALWQERHALLALLTRCCEP
jgi:hypothetical protein